MFHFTFEHSYNRTLTCSKYFRHLYFLLSHLAHKYFYFCKQLLKSLLLKILITHNVINNICSSFLEKKILVTSINLQKNVLHIVTFSKKEKKLKWFVMTLVVMVYKWKYEIIKINNKIRENKFQIKKNQVNFVEIEKWFSSWSYQVSRMGKMIVFILFQPFEGRKCSTELMKNGFDWNCNCKIVSVGDAWWGNEIFEWICEQITSWDVDEKLVFFFWKYAFWRRG